MLNSCYTDYSIANYRMEGHTLSSPTRAQLFVWRAFLESSLALVDILDEELQADVGLSLRWYDLLVQLEDEEEGLKMNELANRILTSKSGLTRVIDNMEQAGLLRRQRTPRDRRAVLVAITPKGRRVVSSARVCHHGSIREHFSGILNDDDLGAIAVAMAKISEHARPLRPGRISA